MLLRTGFSKRVIFVFVLLLTLSIFMSSSFVNSEIKNECTYLESTDEEYVLYEGYVSVNSSIVLRNGSLITWRFIGSNPNVDILVYLMTMVEFQKFEVDQNTGSKVILSSGENLDSGNYTVLAEDVWVIVFYNIDDNMLGINLVYFVEFFPKGIDPLNLTGPIIGGTASIVILTGFIYILIRKRKKLPIIPMSKNRKESIRLLEKFHQETGFEKKLSLVKALGELKSAKAVPTLISLIKESDENELLMACFNSLILINSRKAIPELLSIIGNFSIESKRKLAILTLGKMRAKSKRVTSYLGEVLLTEQNPNIKTAIVITLGFIGSSRNASSLYTIHQQGGPIGLLTSTSIAISAIINPSERRSIAISRIKDRNYLTERNEQTKTPLKRWQAPIGVKGKIEFQKILRSPVILFLMLFINILLLFPVFLFNLFNCPVYFSNGTLGVKLLGNWIRWPFGSAMGDGPSSGGIELFESWSINYPIIVPILVLLGVGLIISATIYWLTMRRRYGLCTISKSTLPGYFVSSILALGSLLSIIGLSFFPSFATQLFDRIAPADRIGGLSINFYFLIIVFSFMFIFSVLQIIFSGSRFTAEEFKEHMEEVASSRADYFYGLRTNKILHSKQLFRGRNLISVGIFFLSGSYFINIFTASERVMFYFALPFLCLAIPFLLFGLLMTHEYIDAEQRRVIRKVTIMLIIALVLELLRQIFNIAEVSTISYIVGQLEAEGVYYYGLRTTTSVDLLHLIFAKVSIILLIASLLTFNSTFRNVQQKYSVKTKKLILPFFLAFSVLVDLVRIILAIITLNSGVEPTEFLSLFYFNWLLVMNYLLPILILGTLVEFVVKQYQLRLSLLYHYPSLEDLDEITVLTKDELVPVNPGEIILINKIDGTIVGRVTQI